MKKGVISNFKDTPKTKTGWWAFGLSLFSIATGPILGINAAFIVPFLSERVSEEVGLMSGFATMTISLIILVASLFLSIKAYRMGERSWAVWGALILSITSVAFLIFMIVGEFLFPH